MAHSLRLNVYQIGLKERNKQTDELIPFNTFYQSAFKGEEEAEVSKEELYKRFSFAYYKSFDNKFKRNTEATKAFVPEKETVKFIRALNTFDGMVKGGATGINLSVYDLENPEVQETVIGKQKVSTLPFYFLLWMPPDTNFGILMIQSYTDNSITAIFKDHLRKFFATYQYTLVESSFFPEEIKQKYINSSHVYKLSFIKTGLSNSAKSKFNPLFAQEKSLKVEINISGFSTSPINFINKLKLSTGKLFNSNLSDLEMESTDDYETRIYYEDKNGTQTHAKYKTSLDLTPNIPLDNSLKVEGEDYPDYKQIKDHCFQLLNTIKNEIGYTPNVE